MVAGDAPGLVEATGPGGLVVPVDDVDEWCRSIRALWSDHETYGRLADASRRHSERDAISAATVAGRFEQLLHAVVAGEPRGAT